MFDSSLKIYLDEGAGGAGAGGQQPSSDGGQAAGEQQPASFDAWYTGQPAEVKTLLDGHISGLKTALSSERDRNKTLVTELRDAASKAEKGSENEKRLTEMANQVQESGRKLNFYESAGTAGVANVKLAYIAAVNDDLFKKDGSVDFEALKKGYPELFGAARQQSNNAGSGGNGQAAGKQSMDAFIRSRVNGG